MKKPVEKKPATLVRLHAWCRLIGVTSLVLGIASLVLVKPTSLGGAVSEIWNQIRTMEMGFACKVVLVEFAIALLVLVLEILIMLKLAAGRKNIAGAGATLQAILAVTLFVGVNLFSYSHYQLVDTTLGRLFTLPADLKSKLENLRDETTIVVCQLHKTFGKFTEKPDRFDYAAERVVVAKVKDLVDQLRELGPKFRVQVLDVEDENYERRLADLTSNAPQLRKAIETAPENSIFFWAKNSAGSISEMIQRMSFNDFYRLDKTASVEANQQRGNLMLLPQGREGSGAVEPFVRKILALEARKPRVAVAVVDEWLTTRGTDSFGYNGLRKSLESHGFEVKDLILRKLRQRPASSVAYTFDESKLDRLDQRIRVIDTNLERFEKGLGALGKMVLQWKGTPLSELEKAYSDQLRGAKLSEENRKAQVEYFEGELKNLQEARDRLQKQKLEVVKEKSSLDVDSLIEQQRMTDLEAKMNLLLADCDLLLVPRPTLHDVITDDRNLPHWLHGLEKAQIDAMQSFIKSGKPVFALLGPTSEPQDQGPVPQGFVANDGFEDLLAKLGFKLGKQTVLFDEEVEGFSEQMAGLLTGGTGIQAPPLLLDWGEGAGRPVALKPNFAKAAHPIRESLKLTGRSQSPDKPLELRLRHPRPVYFDAPQGVNLVYNPELFQTSRDSWNESQPFPEMQGVGERKIPSYNPDDKDPNKGTLEARRRGPFPVGAAAEVPVPAEWYTNSPPKKLPSVRLAVVGESWFLSGPELPPVKERFALDVCNWLLGREDFLPRPSTPWKYPRIEMQDRTRVLWLWGTQLGMPAFFAYLGFVVLIQRRMR